MNKKKKIAVIAVSYPTSASKYVAQFIKTRVEEYDKHFSVKVFVYNNMLDITYTLDKVKVYVGQPLFIKENLIEYQPDILVLHACSGNRRFNKMILHVKKILNIPLILNIHGFEVMDLLVYTAYEVYNIKSFIRHIILGLRQYMILWANRIIVENADLIISPSQWMHKIAEKSLFLKIKNVKYIPNFIDSRLFKNRNKKRENHILSIRSFDYRKYANDISVKVVYYLYKKYKRLIKNFKIRFYGKGKFLNKVQKRDHKNLIQFIPDFIEHKNMNNIFNQYKYFLCPTRTDAQGVSMCEAMMSGLIPVTNKNTAIPEFVPEELLNKNYKDMGELIAKLEQDQRLYKKIQKKTRDFIKEKCSYQNTIKQELDLYKRYCKKEK